MELPDRVKAIRQLLPLSQIFDGEHNSIFGVLSQEGVLQFISLNTYKIIFAIGGVSGAVAQAAASPNSKHIAVITDGGSLQVE